MSGAKQAGEGIWEIHFDGYPDALEHLQAAESRNETLDLVTRPAASAYLGAAYIAALDRQLRQQSPALNRLIYDCGGYAGHVMQAAMHGIAHVQAEAAIVTPALSAFCQLRGTTLHSRAG